MKIIGRYDKIKDIINNYKHVKDLMKGIKVRKSSLVAGFFCLN